MANLYCLGGKVLDSEVPLGLPPVDSGLADVEVREGGLGERIHSPIAEGVNWQASSDVVSVRLKNSCEFTISKGGVRFSATPDVSSHLLRYALSNAALPHVMPFHDRLVLHASAARFGGRAILFAGHSGAGKSTTLLECLRSGAGFITDDVSVVGADERGQLVVWPWFPTLGLWPDVESHFSIAAKTRGLRPGIAKRLLDLPSGSPEPTPIAAVFLLSATGDGGLSRLEGAASFAALRLHVRGRRIAEATAPALLFRLLAALIDSTPVFMLGRGSSGLGGVSERVQQAMAASAL